MAIRSRTAASQTRLWIPLAEHVGVRWASSQAREQTVVLAVIAKQTRGEAHRRQMAGREKMVKMEVARSVASSPGLCVETVGQEWVSRLQPGGSGLRSLRSA